MRRVGLIDITVGNATRLGASQRCTTRRCASHHIATQRANRWGHPAAPARLARTVTPSAFGSETVMCSAHILCRPILAECITNMPGFNLRQAQHTALQPSASELPPAEAASIHRTCSARLPTDPDAPNIAVLPNHVATPVGVAIIEGQVEFVR
jgi:hypothetical protein